MHRFWTELLQTAEEHPYDSSAWARGEAEEVSAALARLAEQKRTAAAAALASAGELVKVLEAESAGLDERVTLDMALKMDGRYFECLANVLWSKRGYPLSTARAYSANPMRRRAWLQSPIRTAWPPSSTIVG